MDNTSRITNEIEIAIATARDNKNGDITDAELALCELTDEYDVAAIAAHVYNCGLKLDKADDWAYDFRESYIGVMTPAEYAEQLIDGVVDIPEELQYYIDYEKMGRDMEMGGDIVEIDGYLFRTVY